MSFVLSRITPAAAFISTASKNMLLTQRRNMSHLGSFSASRLLLSSPSNTASVTSSRGALLAQLNNSAPTFVSPSVGTGSNVLASIFGLQRRWKSRGNTYQPSTFKRKRRFGFLSRLKTRQGKKIVARRREKGRWYLTH